MNKTDFNKKADELRQRVHEQLEHHLPPAEQAPTRLHQAMRYAVLNGGKRIRALLVYLTGESFGADLDNLDMPACAVELIHAYSLVHDDLPAMDDDDLRRGHPTCHKTFDEATAILVGDALQCLAIELLTQQRHQPSERIVQMIRCLIQASGSLGMAGGQSLDLEAEGQRPAVEVLEEIYRLKTGALIRASIELGALAAGFLPIKNKSLEQFSDALGLAFQIQDDILDIESTTEVLGKRQGADIKRNKPTYPASIGMDQAKAKVAALSREARICLEELPIHSLSLRLMVDDIILRQS